MGDRILSVSTGNENFFFNTQDTNGNNLNVNQQIRNPTDSEGIWTYIYYSYSVKEKSAWGYLRQGSEETIKFINQRITHPLSKTARF